MGTKVNPQKFIKAFLGGIGIDVFRKKPDHHYVLNYYGRSAHKQLDLRTLAPFEGLAGTAIQQGRTLLYYDRLYTIYQALVHVKRLCSSSSQVNLAEIGVYKGGTSYFIASTAKTLEIKSSTLYAFDTFEGHAVEDVRKDVDTFHEPQYFGDTEFNAVSGYLRQFNDSIVLYKGRFQDACSKIGSQKFHFVHSDVDIYDPTAFILNFFDNKLVLGGIVVVDDYGFTTCPGVRRAVDEFVTSRKNYFGSHLITGQYMLVKYQEG